jgi:hypothetical protein
MIPCRVVGTNFLGNQSRIALGALAWTEKLALEGPRLVNIAC